MCSRFQFIRFLIQACLNNNKFRTILIRGMMGTASTLGWRDDTLGKGISLELNGQTYDFSFAGKRSITDLVNEINAKIGRAHV